MAPTAFMRRWSGLNFNFNFNFIFNWSEATDVDDDDDDNDDDDDDGCRLWGGNLAIDNILTYDL